MQVCCRFTVINNDVLLDYAGLQNVAPHEDNFTHVLTCIYFIKGSLLSTKQLHNLYLQRYYTNYFIFNWVIVSWMKNIEGFLQHTFLFPDYTNYNVKHKYLS